MGCYFGQPFCYWQVIDNFFIPFVLWILTRIAEYNGINYSSNDSRKRTGFNKKKKNKQKQNKKNKPTNEKMKVIKKNAPKSHS